MGGAHTGINVGFTASTVNFEEAAEVDVEGGISMEEFDGREEPVHARKVSVRKPEIIGLFEYHPIFKEIMQGDDQEKQKVLTDAGRYIDTQITARKIRLDDIRLLFEQLSKDPESPTGQIVENLIEVLDSKMTDVKNDFEAIKTVSDAVLQFLDTLDLRRPSTSQKNVFKSLREKRFEENPLKLPRSENKSLDFNLMLTTNHGERTMDIDPTPDDLEGSGTKVFLNFVADLDVLMHGAINFPSPAIGNRIRGGQSSDVFSVKRGTNTRPQTLSPIVNIANGYGAAAFGGGVCSTQLSIEASGDGSLSFSASGNGQAGPADAVIPSIDGQLFTNIFYKGQNGSTGPGKSCALISQTIADDLAASSALGNDNFVNSLNNDFGGLQRDNVNFARVVSGIDRLSSIIDEGQSNNLAEAGGLPTTGLVSAALYDPDGSDGTKSPIRTFDPGVLSVPDGEGVAKKIQNTAYDQLLKPILESMQEGDNVTTEPLKAFVNAVPDTLTKAGDALDQYFATSDPVLNPKAILIKVLTSIRSRVPDLNIGEGVDFSDAESAPMSTGPMIDFCLLAESSRDLGMALTYRVQNFGTTGNDNRRLRKRLRVNDLLTMFLISLGKSSGVTGKYESIIGMVKEDNTVRAPDFTDLGRDLAKHIYMNLLNTYTSDAMENGIRIGHTTHHSPERVMGTPDTERLDLDSTVLDFGGSDGVTSAQFAGAALSRSRGISSQRVTRWDTVARKLSYSGIENENPDYPPSGALARPDSTDERDGIMLVDDSAIGAVRTGGDYDNSPFKKIYGNQIEERLTRVVGIERNDSIFTDIIDVVNEIYAAAIARGPIVDSATGKMISSGVDPAYIMSFVTSLYSIIIKDLLLLRFTPSRMYYREGEHGHGGDTGIHSELIYNFWGAGRTIATMQIENVVRSREFISDLNNFLTPTGEVDTLPDPGSKLGRFLSEFNEQVDENTRMRLDSIDMLRTLGDSLSSAANRYIEAFVNDKNQIRVDKGFERIKAVLPLAINRTQVIAMRNQLQNVESKEGFSRYFDDFMLSQAQENFFYGSLFGPGQGFQSYRPSKTPQRPLPSVNIGNRVNFHEDKNAKILTFGIPQGFSKTVLGIDPVLEPNRFAERLVDVYVIAKDHISGEALSIIPQPYTFDLGLFFDSVSDPVVSSPQTNSKLNEETSPEFVSNFNQSIVNRKYPTREEIFKSNVNMRRMLLKEGGLEVETRPTTGPDLKAIAFDNHVYDVLAKMYIKLTTGMSVTENDFFIDPSIEQKLATEPDLRNLSSLIDTHISQILGRDITFNDYLSGDRKFRELLNRLSKGEKTAQVIDEIKVNLEGTTEDANTLSSEDLVAFSRMISSNNPIITPGLFRDKIVSPRLFERVFSVFINPDKFIGLPWPGSPHDDGTPHMLTNNRQFRDELTGNVDYLSLGLNPAVEPISPSMNRIGGQRSQQFPGLEILVPSLIKGFTDDSTLPKATMYQVLVVPHKTRVDFYDQQQLANRARGE